MSSKNRTILLVIGGVIVLMVAIGAIGLVSTSVASAQSTSLRRAWNSPLNDISMLQEGGDGFAQRGGRGFPGRGEEYDTYLAEALGITFEELQLAYETARDAAITKAVEEGLITKEHADAMKEKDHGIPGLRLKPGRLQDGEKVIDFEALLADALGIQVEELASARQKASEAVMQAKVESGELTSEQVEMIQARQALKNYLDKDALFEEALGITVEEMQDALRAAYEAAVKKAVDDGVITKEQADQILSEDAGFNRGGAGWMPLPGFEGPGRGGHGGKGGFGRFPFPMEPNIIGSDNST